MEAMFPEDQGALFNLWLADPAAGAPVEIYAAAGQRYSLDAISLVLTTSAAVANRTVGIEFYNVTIGAQGRIWCNAAQVASLALSYHFSKWFSGNPWSVLGNFFFPLRGPTIIDGALGIRILADNIQAADQFSLVMIRGQKWLND